MNTVVTRLGEKDTIGELSDTGTEDQVVELIARHGERLRRLLKVPAQPAAAEWLAQAVPSTAASRQLYAEALDLMRRYEWADAEDMLVKLTALQPDFALGFARLSEVWAALGFDAKARDMSDRARELAERLPREQQLLVNAQFFSTRGDWAAAIGVWRAVFGLYPDNLDYGLELARTQFLGAERRAALDTLGDQT